MPTPPFRLIATLPVVALAVALPVGGEAHGCVPSADKVIAWDAGADLYVVATYLERERPPAGDARIYPNLIELRRLSTGAQLALVNCADRPGALTASAASKPCDFRLALLGHLPAAASFRRVGSKLGPDVLQVRAFGKGAGRTYALMSHSSKSGSAGWYRVRWLGQPVTPPEEVSPRLLGGERVGDDVLVSIEERHRGGACGSTTAYVLRLRGRDLEAPAAAEHQAHLLAQLKESSPFALWRTAAEIAPLPPARLISGMVVAAEARKPDYAIRWWNETVSALPIEQVGPLGTALRDRPELREVLQAIKLPTPPPPPPPAATPPPPAPDAAAGR